jgi:hypothetical protein
MSAPQTLVGIGNPLLKFLTRHGGLAQIIKIGLLRSIAGAPYNTMTPNQLAQNSSPFSGTFNCSIADAVEIYLLDAINSGGGSGGGRGTSATFAGHYAGGPPSNDPTPMNGDIATDLDAGNRQWVYILPGGWQ